MSEPKRGEHYDACIDIFPFCKCNTCRIDNPLDCAKKHPKKGCPIENCEDYIKDEPTKKGAADV